MRNTQHASVVHGWPALLGHVLEQKPLVALKQYVNDWPTAHELHASYDKAASTNASSIAAATNRDAFVVDVHLIGTRRNFGSHSNYSRVSSATMRFYTC